MNRAFIYALLDPRTNEARYVGKTNNPSHRMKQHLRNKEVSCYKRNWIESLNNSGLVPVQIILEEVPWDEWQESERFWIAYFKFMGSRLTNLNSGGIGQNEMSQETRNKIRLSKLGKSRPKEVVEKVRLGRRYKKLTDEHKAKMSLALKGRKQSDGAKSNMAIAQQKNAMVKPGARFGSLVVLERVPNSGLARKWHCLCDCGNKTIKRAASLTRDKVDNCGCRIVKFKKGWVAEAVAKGAATRKEQAALFWREQRVALSCAVTV